MRGRLIAVLAVVGSAGAWAAEGKAAPKAKAKPKPPSAPKAESFGPGTYALLKTTEGEILIRLTSEAAPRTVANFVGLARGTRPWKDKDFAWVARPFYDGLTFHRIEKDSLIQGGCPRGDGSGGPGYRIDLETSETLRFDKPGIVALARPADDRNGNGSQFFITLAPKPQFDGDYSIFGEVVHGLEVVRAISRMPAEPTTPSGSIHRAQQPVTIRKVVIQEVAAEAPPAAPKAAPADK